MQKISTLFEIIYSEKGYKDRITSKVRPENEWVFNDFNNVKVTRKYDGSACAIINSELYKRYDCRINKSTGKYKKEIPKGAISCGIADKITGHHPHWIKCMRDNPADKFFFEAFDLLEEKIDRTYELCGPKVNSNKENLKVHTLIPHGKEIIILPNLSYDGIKDFLSESSNDIEGIVFYHRDGRMCKIRKDDFGYKR